MHCFKLWSCCTKCCCRSSPGPVQIYMHKASAAALLAVIQAAAMRRWSGTVVHAVGNFMVAKFESTAAEHVKVHWAVVVQDTFVAVAWSVLLQVGSGSATSWMQWLWCSKLPHKCLTAMNLKTW